jgi:hypothetical protein
MDSGEDRPLDFDDILADSTPLAQYATRKNPRGDTDASYTFAPASRAEI